MKCRGFLSSESLLQNASDDAVFSLYGGGLGDRWGATSFLLRLSEATGRPSKIAGDSDSVLEFAQMLDTNGSVEATRQPATIRIGSPRQVVEKVYGNFEDDLSILPWAEVFRLPYLQTRWRWRPNVDGLVCVHLTPSKTGLTTCPGRHVLMLREALEAVGYVMREFGPNLSLQQNLEIAASAEFFVGIDSGPSHLVHSVGIPMHLVRNHLPLHHIRSTHHGKAFCVYRDLLEFVASSVLTGLRPSSGHRL